MSKDPEIRMHKEWQGLLQPVGLVVSPLALVRKQAVIDRNGAVRWQAQLEALLDDSAEAKPPVLRDLLGLLEGVLGWAPQELHGGDPERGSPPLPESLEVRLPELDELLQPTYAVADPAEAGDGGPKWLMLVQELAARVPMDEAPKDGGRGWHAPPQAKLERMLKELGVPMGLLCNGEALRLVYAPRGETSGHVTFPLGATTTAVNWPVAGALHMLLSGDRLLGMASDRRLLALLEESRKYQNEVSTKLAEQVLQALIELLRGFGAADEASGGRLLGEQTGHDPTHVYGGLLTVLLRLVFLLYAEDRGLLPDDPVWSGHYSVVGLFERLREDAGRYPDTMDQRYGAWASLLTLFRLVFLGGGHGAGIRLPARRGELFDPNEYPFLEGRGRAGGFDPGERLEPPRVSDGTLFRVLQGLLVLDGERLSYRSLDVEQIGSVYESMMGYEVERAKGASIGVGPQHVVVDLEALLKEKASKRGKWLEAAAGVKVSGGAAKELEAARTAEEVVAALQRRVSKRTPGILAKGSLYLQPGEERRRTGSHYTPRSLTEPIVRTTLRPVLEELGGAGEGAGAGAGAGVPRVPTEAEILGLKVCDPAMGSGAFLVEACRQLAEALERSWQRYGTTRVVPADEEPLLHARRLVAEHCLYGVDKNPFAVSLAKLSLWLATLAKDHPFTFLDHALKCGDSLVGLSRRQIAEFRWDDEVVEEGFGPLFAKVKEQVVAAVEARARIRGCGEDEDAEKRAWNDEAERALEDARLQADAVVAAFFGGEKAKEREERRKGLWEVVQRWHAGEARARNQLEDVVAGLRGDGVVPFHWEIEFPEVFGDRSSGFSCIVGNPPFLGGTRISTALGMPYFAYLRDHYPPAGHLCDLVAYFFRRCHDLAQQRGTFGLIATNTIGQGDTRTGGLGEIIRQEGEIYSAIRRHVWKGMAAVFVSIVHVAKGIKVATKLLDGVPVDGITAYLFHLGTSEEPRRLAGRNEKFSAGSKIYGQGFCFDDDDPRASSIATMNRLLAANPTNRGRIFPYIGGKEVNGSPAHEPQRHVIYLSDIGTEEELTASWPELAAIVREKVKPERDQLSSNPNSAPLKRKWWAYQAHRPDLYKAMESLVRVLVNSQVSAHLAFCYQPTDRIFAHTLNIFIDDTWQFFGVLQSRPHEIWARFFGSSLEDRLRYTPTDCFETFPFPPNWQSNPTLERTGQTYYDYRAALMIRANEGLTKTYNRFHDPDETSPEILELRRLHAEMDHAVLTAYGWDDLAARATCEFALDYEEPEDEDDDGSSSKRKKKKPWRYKWPQALHDEVLARLLELNAQYAEAERLAGESAGAGRKGKGGKATASTKSGGKKKTASKKTASKKKAAKDASTQVALLDDE